MYCLQNIKNVQNQPLTPSNIQYLPENLPDEILFKIFACLGSLGSIKDITALGETCKKLYIISQDNQLWKHLFQNHFPSSNSREKYQTLYKKSTSVIDNIINNKHKTIEIEGVIDNCIVEDHFIWKSQDDKINILNFQHQECHTIENIGNNIIDAKGKHLITQDGEGQTKIWDIETRCCLKELNLGENSTIIHMTEIHFVTREELDQGKEVKFWKNATGEQYLSFILKPINNFNESDYPELIGADEYYCDPYNLESEKLNRSLAYHYSGNYLIQHIDNGQYLFLDLETGEKLVPSHKEPFSLVKIDSNYLLTTTKNGVIQVWNTKRGNSLVIDHPSIDPKSCFFFGKHLLTSGADDCFKLWDIETGICLLENMTGFHSIQNAQIIGNRLFVYAVEIKSSWREKLYIWDIKTGGHFSIENVVMASFFALSSNFALIQGRQYLNVLDINKKTQRLKYIVSEDSNYFKVLNESNVLQKHIIASGISSIRFLNNRIIIIESRSCRILDYNPQK